MEIIILNLYKKYHSGKENAITRSSFIFIYLDDIVGITDRCLYGSGAYVMHIQI